MGETVLALRIEEKEELEELFDVLNGKAMPFDYPPYFMWPKNQKSLSRRAEVLLMAGLEYLKEKYPKRPL